VTAKAAERFFHNLRAIDKPWLSDENPSSEATRMQRYFRVPLANTDETPARFSHRIDYTNDLLTTEHPMSALRAVPVLDLQPVLNLIQERGGVCTFDEALRVLVQRGFSETSARDALWQFLSDGRLEFTSDRQLRAP
jgi:hypothetical protein